MTLSAVSYKIPPQQWYKPQGTCSSVPLHPIDECILSLDDLIVKIAAQRDALVEYRFRDIQQAQRERLLHSALGKLPIEAVAVYLRASDIKTLANVSRHFNDLCQPNGQLLLAHLKIPSISPSDNFIESVRFRTNPSLIESLQVDSKNIFLLKRFMEVLSKKGSYFTSLKSLRVNAAAQDGTFLFDLYEFINQIPRNQLTCIHLSGFNTLREIGLVLKSQSLSIEKLQVDYLVNGHERDIDADMLPVMPNLTSLIYDVADVTDASAKFLTSRLECIVNKNKVKTIYLPHVQIGGSATDVQEFIDYLKGFQQLSQLVVRFRNIPLSISSIISLRESFSHLPAVCISDHFIVCQSTWCSWWPALKNVWASPDLINGWSVFCEQIDFHSLGSSAATEWAKLSDDRKTLWSTLIASGVSKLYAKLDVTTPSVIQNR